MGGGRRGGLAVLVEGDEDEADGVLPGVRLQRPPRRPQQLHAQHAESAALQRLPSSHDIKKNGRVVPGERTRPPPRPGGWS